MKKLFVALLMMFSTTAFAESTQTQIDNLRVQLGLLTTVINGLVAGQIDPYTKLNLVALATGMLTFANQVSPETQSAPGTLLPPAPDIVNEYGGIYTLQGTNVLYAGAMTGWQATAIATNADGDVEFLDLTGHWQLIDDNGMIELTTPPPGYIAPGMPSPPGTTITAGSGTLTDNAGNVWSILTAPRGALMANGVQVGGFWAAQARWTGGRMEAQNQDNGSWSYLSGSAWIGFNP